VGFISHPWAVKVDVLSAHAGVAQLLINAQTGPILVRIIAHLILGTAWGIGWLMGSSATL
jgi:hypothetical protein